MDFSPWGRKKLDMTERLHFTSSFHSILFLGGAFAIWCITPNGQECGHQTATLVLMSWYSGHRKESYKTSTLKQIFLSGVNKLPLVKRAEVCSHGAALALNKMFSLVQFNSVAQSCLNLRRHELQHTRPPFPSPSPGVHSDSRPSSQ